jgi:hypothetical protein
MLARCVCSNTVSEKLSKAIRLCRVLTGRIRKSLFFCCSVHADAGLDGQGDRTFIFLQRSGSLPTAVQHMHERTAARVSGSPLSYSLFRLDADVWNLSTREVEIVDVKVCYVIST